MTKTKKCPSPCGKYTIRRGYKAQRGAEEVVSALIRVHSR